MTLSVFIFELLNSKLYITLMLSLPINGSLAVSILARLQSLSHCLGLEPAYSSFTV